MLDKLMNRTGCDAGEIIERCFMLYDLASDLVAQGGAVVFKGKSGEETEVIGINEGPVL